MHGIGPPGGARGVNIASRARHEACINFLDAQHDEGAMPRLLWGQRVMTATRLHVLPVIERNKRLKLT